MKSRKAIKSMRKMKAMNIILGLASYDRCVNLYNKDSGRTKHFEDRKLKLSLCSPIAEPLHYFEVYREKDKSFQIHCLYEDASLLIFNKKEAKLITIILLNPTQVQYYLKKANDDLQNHKKVSRSARLNKKLPRNLEVLGEEKIKEISRKKNKYMNIR